MRSANFSWWHLAVPLLVLICDVGFSQTDSSALPDDQKRTALHLLKKRERIRVEVKHFDVAEGRFRALQNDTLLLRSDSAKVIALPVAEVQSLWVRTNSAQEGATAGAILGAIPGAIVGARMAGIANLDCESNCIDLTVPMIISGSIGALMGAAGGMTIGSVIGATIPQWRRVYP